MLLVSGAAGLQLHKNIKLAAPALPVVLPSAALAAADSYEYGSARRPRPLHEISSTVGGATPDAARRRGLSHAPVRRRAKPIVTPRRAQVAAPDWVLPAGAVLAIATALLPLARARASIDRFSPRAARASRVAMPAQALKDGEEAAEEIFQQDESVRSLDSRKNRRV